MIYSPTSKKASEIAYSISLHVPHFGAPGIFQYDNGREFKGALKIFLNKHDIKLINGHHGHQLYKDLLKTPML